MPLIEINNLSAFYGKPQALSDVSLHVDQGETIAIVGANGAGKSTLLDCIMGMVKTTGTIRLNGEDITSRKPGYMVKAGIG